MTDSRRTKSIARPVHHYALLLASAVCVALFVACLEVFMYTQVETLTSRTLSVADVVSSRKFDQARASEVKRVFDATAADRAAVRSLFVPSDGLVTFIESLEAIGSSTGASLSVSSIQADDLASADPGTIGSIQARIDASGSWASVMRTLSLLENMKYAASVDSVRLYSSRAAGDQRQRSVWTLSVDIKALSVATSQAANRL